MSQSFNQEHRFGSASWADSESLTRAGLFRKSGPQIGYWGNLPLYLDGDAPMITIGGAGSGKLRDLLAYVVCSSPGLRMAILDPRGELGAISISVHAPRGEYAYFWNPLGLCGLPSHRCNPLDILRAGSPRLHADCKFIAEGLVPLNADNNGMYFILRARDWIENLIKSLVEQHDHTSLPALYRIINAIESDVSIWSAQLEKMMASRHEGVRRTAGEMLSKQQDAPKEFGAIMGEIYAHLSFLDDPILRASLESADFSLEVLCDPSLVAKVFFNVPAEYLSVWSPLVRLFFTVTMLYKSRVPERPKILLLADESGQLGRFEALLRAFTYGRGAGLRAWAIFQDAGQIVRNFGAPALQGFLGSAQMRQFFGVRDYQTAQLVSDMAGTETLEYADHFQQDAARRQKWETVSCMFGSDDPFAAAYDYAHHARNAERLTKQARKIVMPEEVLALPEDQQILFIAGKNLPSVVANKYAYYMRREMAGLYLANPHHPPLNRVPIVTRFGTKWVDVITEEVPAKFATFPQHQSGFWSYVKGYKPA